MFLRLRPWNMYESTHVPFPPQPAIFSNYNQPSISGCREITRW
jgi:hypothetical protein